jgi:uncharacterized protein VirK/YbjX
MKPCAARRDESSQKRFGSDRRTRSSSCKGDADYDEIWQAEKAQAQGSARSAIDKMRLKIAEFDPERRLQIRSRNCSTANCPRSRSA